MAKIEILDGMTDLDTVYIPDEDLAGMLGEVGADLGSKEDKRKRRAKRRLHKLKQVRPKAGGAIVEVRPAETKDMTGKALFERRLYKIDKNNRNGLTSGDLTISDQTVFAVKLAGDNRTEMFKTGDKEEDGVGNLVGAKLPNNGTMLVTSIFLFSGVGAGTTEDDGKVVDFGKVNPIVANGSFTIKSGQKTFSEKTSCRVFSHEGNSELRPGEYRLANPILLSSDKVVLFDIDTPSGMPANTFLYVALNGVMTVKS